jgi:hypothetical protein
MMRAVISLFAVMLLAGVGCSKTDDAADRGGATDQTTPSTTPGAPSDTPSDTTGDTTMPSDETTPPATTDETTPPAPSPNP